jgi:hypothetical protein
MHAPVEKPLLTGFGVAEDVEPVVGAKNTTRFSGVFSEADEPAARGDALAHLATRSTGLRNLQQSARGNFVYILIMFTPR